MAVHVSNYLGGVFKERFAGGDVAVLEKLVSSGCAGNFFLNSDLLISQMKQKKIFLIKILYCSFSFLFNFLGRKTKKGIYVYSDAKAKVRPVNETAEKILKDFAIQPVEDVYVPIIAIR